MSAERPFCCQQFIDAAACAACNSVFLYGHNVGMAIGDGNYCVPIQWFYEPHVDQRRIQLISYAFAGLYHAAERKNGQPAALAERQALTQRNRRHFLFDFYSRPAATWIAHRGRALVPESGIQHLPAFIFIGRRHDDHARNAAHETEIETARVSRSVRPHQAGAVDGEQHGKILQCHIVNQLVVRPLQKSAVDRNHRVRIFTGHAGSQRNAVLFGNTDIEIAVGKRSWNSTSPEPSRIAGVIASRRWSCSAMSQIQSPNTSV